MSEDNLFISSRDNLPVTSNSSSQKLKTSTFSCSNQKKVTDSDGLPPPSKKPASGKELARLSSSQYLSFDTSIHCLVPCTPNSTTQVNPFISTMIKSVSSSSVIKSPTPKMTPSSKHNTETPSLPVTPVSYHSIMKRIFPGPAGLIPVRVRKLLLYTIFTCFNSRHPQIVAAGY